MKDEAETRPRLHWARPAVRIIMAILGTLGGAVLGLAILLAIVVAKARAGYYTFSLHDLVALRPETLPVLAGAIGGGVLGYRHPRTLDRAALRGFGAMAIGIVTGALFGRLVWGASEGAWAGAIIVGTLGLAAGAASATRRRSREPHPLLSGFAGATALAGMGLVGIIGVVGASDLAPLEFEDVEAARLPDPAGVDAVVFLLGDAGQTDAERSPLLHALHDDIDRWSGQLARDSAVSVVFLGDLVYPVGVRDRDHPEFPRDSARLWNQIALVEGEHAVEHATLGLFITGNHDWGNTAGEAGIDRVLNLGVQLDAARRAGHYVSLLPPAGEPGPVIRDLRSNVRILFLDTHWFLQERSVRQREEFFERLQSALDGAGQREVILVAHHPYYSAGPHGTVIPGYYSGGIAYLLKQSGTLVQDLNSPVYSDFLVRLRQIFRAANRPPLVFAGGHDHSLQVLESAGDFDPRFSLVSGAGSKLSAVRASPGLAWGAARPGYMMLVFRKDDGVDLFAIAGSRDHLHCGGSDEALATCMTEGINAFDVAYSATLLDAARQPVELPAAAPDTAPARTPWWTEDRSAEGVVEAEAGERADTVPAGVPARLLAHGADSVIALPGRSYRAGWGRRVLFGDLNRDLWTVPVKLPVLDLTAVGGGLEPIELTGGLQTVGLRFRGADGLEYEFRPIVKDPRRILPERLRDGLIGDLVDDQMAAQFPFAAVVVNALLEAAGIAAPRQRPVVMPDTEQLGEFRERFAGRVGLFGLHADEREGDRPGFAGYSRIVDTEELFEELQTHPDARIDARHYLRIRLIDMLVGDWDRHAGQWRWGRSEDGAEPTWRAIPEDRDWAFPVADGVANAITRLFMKRFVSFSDEYPSVAALAEASEPVDRVVLRGLAREEYRGIAAELQALLTDSVIDAAVRELPTPVHAARGERLRAALRARRAELVTVAEAYYEVVARLDGAEPEEQEDEGG